MFHKKAVLSGKYYASGFDLLDKQLTGCFLHAEGPGELPGKRAGKRAKGVLSPHGQYQTMGQSCAWVYKEIGEGVFPEVFVVVGRGGSREGFFTYLFSGWETPFGVVKVDKERGRWLMEKFPALKNDVSAFFDDDALELQLPFLQFANKDHLREIVILPLLVNSRDYERCAQLGEALAEMSEQGSMCVIGSCNLYGDESDGALVDALKMLDVRKVHDICTVKHAVGDFVVFVEAMKQLFVQHGELLSYQPGYAALVYR